jgi:hypothetical protein
MKLLVNYYNGAKILLLLTVLLTAASVYVDCCTTYGWNFWGIASLWIWHDISLTICICTYFVGHESLPSNFGQKLKDLFFKVVFTAVITVKGLRWISSYFFLKIWFRFKNFIESFLHKHEELFFFCKVLESSMHEKLNS